MEPSHDDGDGVHGWAHRGGGGASLWRGVTRRSMPTHETDGADIGHPAVMTKRSLHAAIGIGLFVAGAMGCGSGTNTAANTDGGTGTTASADGIGDPCVPAQETMATFNGFDEKNVNLETSSTSCKTNLCLVNHFRGRVSCPYGQTAGGKGPSGAPACTIPGTTTPVTGNPSDALHAALVAPQCVDRAADKTVYCSCRCANDQGLTNDGATYCACGDGFECASLVTSIGPSTNDIAGSYCIKNGTAYDTKTACSQGDCDPVTSKCK